MTHLIRPSTEPVTILSNTNAEGRLVISAAMDHAVFEASSDNPSSAYRDIIQQIAEQLYYYVSFDDEVRGTSFDDD